MAAEQRRGDGPQGSESGRADPSGAYPVYTRTGDRGQTGLRGGARIGKDDARVEAYGTIDELNAALGVAREVARAGLADEPALEMLLRELERVQHELFQIGSALAVESTAALAEPTGITLEHSARLERQMDQCSAELAPLSTFIVPGGCALNASLHLARTICRRAERRCVALANRDPVPQEIIVYVNRLSDALFVWARWAAAKLGATETVWQKP